MKQERATPFFYQHQQEQVGRVLGISQEAVEKLAQYVEVIGCIGKKEAMLVLSKADSPSAKRIMKILKLDEQAEEDIENGAKPKIIDEGKTNQHDYRPNITAPTLDREPATQFYSLFSAPIGSPGA